MAIYSNTYGFIITINTGANLSTTTTLRLRIKSPSGVVDKMLDDTNILAPSAKGVVVYTVEDGDFPVGGKYYFQLFDETIGRRLASNVLVVDVKSSLST